MGDEVVRAEREGQVVAVGGQVAAVLESIERAAQLSVAAGQAQKRLEAAERRVKAEVEVERPKIPVLEMSEPKVGTDRQKDELRPRHRPDERADVGTTRSSRQDVPLHAQRFETDVLGARFPFDEDEVG